MKTENYIAANLKREIERCPLRKGHTRQVYDSPLSSHLRCDFLKAAERIPKYRTYNEWE